MKNNKVIRFILKHSISITACVLLIAFGVGYYWASSQTIIGDDITVNNNLTVNGVIGFTGGAGPFCIFSNSCPTGWIDRGIGGYIYNSGSGGTCPYSVGAAYNVAWTWCHPKICCNQ